METTRTKAIQTITPKTNSNEMTTTTATSTSLCYQSVPVAANFIKDHATKALFFSKLEVLEC